MNSTKVLVFKAPNSNACIVGTLMLQKRNRTTLPQVTDSHFNVAQEATVQTRVLRQLFLRKCLVMNLLVLIGLAAAPLK